ncbi:hypothetical protein B7494_g7904 [Chlorociboria aeruginascens]|nr:hypothetical protein B7494_g7904 [Chlorociboria aeruginascens]
MQTDDTLFLGSEKFANLENNKLQKAGLVAKPRDRLQTDSNLVFNGCILTHSTDGIMTIKQKDQGRKLQLIDKISDFKTQYMEQRARGAYIASICQPEAQFDLSVAA